MVHNPTCGCPRCFPINYPDRPNPHGTHGFGSTRNVRHQHESNLRNTAPKEPYSWIWKESLTFYTACWWCGEPVYFHRNENGGCVLFDSLGPPWPIHSCWEQHKRQQSDAIKGLTEKRILQLKSISVRDFQFVKKEYSKREYFDGFILGFDSGSRILPDPARLSDAESFLNYIVFRTKDGEHLKILVPESQKEEIEKCSYVTIHIERYKKNETSVSCARAIETKVIDSQKRHEVIIGYDYERVMNMRWTHQSNLTKP